MVKDNHLKREDVGDVDYNTTRDNRNTALWCLKSIAFCILSGCDTIKGNFSQVIYYRFSDVGQYGLSLIRILFIFTLELPDSTDSTGSPPRLLA